jgi:hypothetical protein
VTAQTPFGQNRFGGQGSLPFSASSFSSPQSSSTSSSPSFSSPFPSASPTTPLSGDHRGRCLATEEFKVPRSDATSGPQLHGHSIAASDMMSDDFLRVVQGNKSVNGIFKRAVASQMVTLPDTKVQSRTKPLHIAFVDGTTATQLAGLFYLVALGLAYVEEARKVVRRGASRLEMTLGSIPIIGSELDLLANDSGTSEKVKEVANKAKLLKLEKYATMDLNDCHALIDIHITGEVKPAVDGLIPTLVTTFGPKVKQLYGASANIADWFYLGTLVKPDPSIKLGKTVKLPSSLDRLSSIFPLKDVNILFGVMSFDLFWLAISRGDCLQSKSIVGANRGSVGLIAEMMRCGMIVKNVYPPGSSDEEHRSATLVDGKLVISVPLSHDLKALDNKETASLCQAQNNADFFNAIRPLTGATLTLSPSLYIERLSNSDTKRTVWQEGADTKLPVFMEALGDQMGFAFAGYIVSAEAGFHVRSKAKLLKEFKGPDYQKAINDLLARNNPKLMQSYVNGERGPNHVDFTRMAKRVLAGYRGEISSPELDFYLALLAGVDMCTKEPGGIRSVNPTNGFIVVHGSHMDRETAKRYEEANKGKLNRTDSLGIGLQIVGPLVSGVMMQQDASQAEQSVQDECQRFVQMVSSSAGGSDSSNSSSSSGNTRQPFGVVSMSTDD